MSYSRQKKDPAQKQQEYYIKQLEQILKLPGNDNCADCGQKGPRWASVNLGIFVCIRCSGIHRNMGTHISKVKSVSLDKWQPDMVEQVKRIGNLNARKIYEGRLPAGFHRPRESDTYAIEQWIRDKYDRKKYYDADAAVAVVSGATEPPKSNTAAPSSKPRRSKPQSQPAQPKASPNLFEIDEPRQTTTAPPAAKPAQAVDFFSDFQTPSSSNNTNFFGGNDSAAFFNQPSSQPAQPQQPTQPTAAAVQPPVQPPADTKSSIMSLFRQQGGMNQMGGQMGMNNMGNMNQMNQMNQMGGMNMYGNQMGGNNMYGNQMNGNNMYGNNQMNMNNQMGGNNMRMNNQMGQMNQMGGYNQQPNAFNW
mmetsp:Transcript_36140/g.62034  ORF Transcript_36140/g.62034 Transcript_36140/m.62034 type:complete len:362 (-) Transcript_36140:40-1125(-)